MTGKSNSSGHPGRREALSAAGASYKFEHLLQHAAEAASPELWRRLLERLEAEDFLARQAEQPDGFEIGAGQLERNVLPAVVELRDWERFFHYLLTAPTLRGLASALDDPTILPALARSGGLELAEALVGRLPHPADRVRGSAVLAAVLSPAEPAFDRLVSALRAEVDGIPERMASDDEAETRRWSGSLATAGRHLAPQLRACWPEWIARLSPRSDLADAVRFAVAEGFFEAGEPEAPELWRLLAEVECANSLHQLLPDRLAEIGAAEPSRWLGILRSRLPRTVTDARLAWSVGLALLARRGAEGAANWPWLCATLDPPSWDRDLLQRGAPLWPRLLDGALQELAARLGTPELASLLRVLVLEGRRDEGSFRAAIARVLELETGAERVTLYLRALCAAPCALSREVESRTKTLLSYLAEIQYGLSPSDLRRALDLVARHLPRHLRNVVDAALAAPASGPETLRTLAEEGEEEGLLRVLFARAETYAAMAAANAAEGFELRRDLLVLLGCRLIERSGDLEAFQQAAERLLPEEEDRLRVKAARLLGSNQTRLTEGLCNGIRDRRLQLQARLELLPEGTDAGDLVAPIALYRAAARLDPMADELRALAGLLREPRHPARLAEEQLEGMSSLGRRVEAFADLARHSLRYQALRFRPDRQDRIAAILPLKEALGVVESDDWIVALTPELVTIGGHLGLPEAMAEVQEAFEQVAGLESVPWERREEVLIDLLGRFEALFLDGGPSAPLGHEPRARRQKRAAELITWLVSLPERVGETPAGEVLRRHWHRLLPLLTAIAESLEPRLAPGQGLLPWAAHLGRGTAPGLAASARQGWQWAPIHGEVFRLCLASADERIARADDLIGGGGYREKAEVPRALALLLARESPARVPPLLGRVAPGPERNRTILELIQSASLPSGVAQELLSLLSSEGAAPDWGKVWLGLRHPTAVPDSEWLVAVVALVAQDRLDPGDPRTAAIRRRLWTLRQEAGLPELAKAALGAIALSGERAGERALRLFLNACVQPRLGKRASDEAWNRCAGMRRALDRAESLETERRPVAPELDDPARDGSDPPAPTGLLAKFRGWSRAWEGRPRHPGGDRASRLSSSPL